MSAGYNAVDFLLLHFICLLICMCLYIFNRYTCVQNVHALIFYNFVVFFFAISFVLLTLFGLSFYNCCCGFNLLFKLKSFDVYPTLCSGASKCCERDKCGGWIG